MDEQILFCKYCGAKIKSTRSKYCDECGKQLREEEYIQPIRYPEKKFEEEQIQPIRYSEKQAEKNNNESISLGKIITILGMIVVIIALCSVLYASLDNIDFNSLFGNSNTYGAGTYKVGVDIPAGEYKFTTTDISGGYIERASDSSMTIDSIISNDITDNSGEVRYVTVSDGEYLKIEGGEITPV